MILLCGTTADSRQDRLGNLSEVNLLKRRSPVQVPTITQRQGSSHLGEIELRIALARRNYLNLGPLLRLLNQWA